jgi:hypothetical protein
MAKKQNKKQKDLFELARAGGLRRKVASAISDGKGAGKKGRKSAEKTFTQLRGLIDELEDRATGGPQKRRAAALKAARTRRRKATQRSNAAKKAAKSRTKARA